MNPSTSVREPAVEPCLALGGTTFGFVAGGNEGGRDGIGQQKSQRPEPYLRSYRLRDNAHPLRGIEIVDPLRRGGKRDAGAPRLIGLIVNPPLASRGSC
jgi:hypothetical protein